MGTIARQALPNFPFGQATTGMSTNPAKSGTELVVCRHGSIGHLVKHPEESVVRDPLGSGEVAEESVAGEQNVALGPGECERKAVWLGECGVAIPGR